MVSFYTILNRFSEAGETYGKGGREGETADRYRVRPLFEAARAYARAGEGKKAESFLRQVCQLTPTDPVPYQLLVNEVLVPRGAITEAKDIVNTGIKQGAPPMILLMSLAEAVRRAGKMDEAKSILQEVLKRYPRTFDAQVRFGRLFLQEQNFDRAVLTLQKAIELQGNSVSALDLLGQAEEGRKQFGAAEKAYATVLHLEPNNALVRQRYVALQQRLNENDLLSKGEEVKRYYRKFSPASIKSQQVAERDDGDAFPRGASQKIPIAGKVFSFSAESIFVGAVPSSIQFLDQSEICADSS